MAYFRDLVKGAILFWNLRVKVLQLARAHLLEGRSIIFIYNKGCSMSHLGEKSASWW